MKKILVLSIALAAGSAWADNGGSAGTFLTLPAGARSAGLAEGGMASPVDANALFQNPASLAGLKDKSVTGTHAAYIDSSFVDQIAYANPQSKWGAWAVGLQYFNAGSIDQTDINGNPSGSLSPNDLALTGGYARTLGAARVGGAVKYVRSKLVDTASTMSVDLGAEVAFLKDRLTLGLAAQNLIGSLKYESENTDLPMQVRAGAAYAVKKNWDAMLDVTLPKDEDSYLALATEYRLNMAAPWGFALRGGYNTRTADIDGFTGFSMGLGVTHSQLRVDYAFLPFGDVGSTHWITLGWKL